MAFSPLRATDYPYLFFRSDVGIRDGGDGALSSRPLLCGEVGTAPLPMDKVAEKVAATLPDSVSVTGVTASSAPERAWQVNLSKPRRASVYVDQYTGKIKGKYERAPFFMTMFRLHRWLLDSMKPNGGIFWGK